MDVDAWLLTLGLEEYALSFAENKIDSGLLLQLTDDDLRALGGQRAGRSKAIACGDLQAGPRLYDQLDFPEFSRRLLASKNSLLHI